jgi:hypothetical protein
VEWWTALRVRERERAHRPGMEKLDRYLQEHFDVPAKNPSEEAQRRWRQAVGTIVKNRRRRFRWVPDLDRRSLDKAKVRSTQVLTNHELPRPNSSILLSAITSFFTASHRESICLARTTL